MNQLNNFFDYLKDTSKHKEKEEKLLSLLEQDLFSFIPKKPIVEEHPTEESSTEDFLIEPEIIIDEIEEEIIEETPEIEILPDI